MVLLEPGHGQERIQCPPSKDNCVDHDLVFGPLPLIRNRHEKNQLAQVREAFRGSAIRIQTEELESEGSSDLARRARPTGL